LGRISAFIGRGREGNFIGSERGEKEYIFIHGKDHRLSNAKRKVKELFERREKAFIHRL